MDIARIRADFPILRQQVHGKPLVYLDNAASVQKPKAVIDAINECYTGYYANIHRGVHLLSERSTAAYEGAREKVRAFLNAASVQEIIFTRSTTESINLVASSFGGRAVKAGDEIVITGMEHHSNIVPWQLLCERTGAVLKVVPFTDAGELILEEYERLLDSGRVKLVAFVHLSNALGTLNPAKQMIGLAHARGIPVLVDGAQSVPHLAVDVQELDCEFYAFSAHKIYGPSGAGVLYGKKTLLEAMPPYQSGGDMISLVTFEKTEYAELPNKFEAGTPNIAGVIGLGAALDWLNAIGLDRVAAHEHALLEYTTTRLSEIPGLKIMGTARNKAALIAFTLQGIHPHDIGTILDREGVAVRAGHHCAQPVMQHYGVPATARASFAVYNTRDEVDVLVAALWKVKEMFEL
ncbi:MAG: cysteine desulfurase [Candidatus Competibacteraceae bacterium]|nr:cysteine desulfurase [Candidatus Competibacteraceae bacterium]MCP5134778.1 cysteine desulfurase [Gammaproteobacteria bacterium]